MMNTILYYMVQSSILSIALFGFVSISLMSFHHIFIIIPAFWFFLFFCKEKKLHKTSRSHLFLMLFICAIVLSVILNSGEIDNIGSSFFKMKYYILPFFAVYAFKYFKKDLVHNRKVRLFFNILFISSAIASLSGLVGYFTGFNPLKFKEVSQTRASGLFGMVMTYAYGISLLASLQTAGLVFRKQLVNLFNYRILLLSSIVNIVSLFFAQTRGALFGYLFSLLIIFFYKSHKVFILCLSVFVLLGVIIFVVIARGNIGSGYLQQVKSESNMNRVYLAQAALKSFVDKPIFGVGFRHFEKVSVELKRKYQITSDPKFLNFRGHAHNNYTEILAGAGIFALIFYLLFLFSWGQEAFVCKASRYLFIPMIFNFALSGLFQSTIIDGEICFFIFAMYLIMPLLKEKTEGNSGCQIE